MLNLLRTRRSIRKYEDRPVSEEHRRLLAEVALRSPTSHNHRPWEFVFVTDRETIASLAGLKPHGSSFLAGAPLAVVVLGDPARSDVWIEDTSIAAAYLHLTAHSLGLGSCWVQVRGRDHSEGTSASDHVLGLVGAPAGLEVLCVIGIGHPAEEKKPVPETALLTDKTHRDRF
jgi:nitroreductase